MTFDLWSYFRLLHDFDIILVCFTIKICLLYLVASFQVVAENYVSKYALNINNIIINKHYFLLATLLYKELSYNK